MTDSGFCSFLLNISQELCSVKDSILCAFVISSFSHVQLFVTLWSVAHQAPLSKGILQASTLERVAMPSSRGSSQTRDQTCICCVTCIAGRFFTESQGKPIELYMQLQSRRLALRCFSGKSSVLSISQSIARNVPHPQGMGSVVYSPVRIPW